VPGSGGVPGMSEKKPAVWLRAYALLVYAYIYMPILILIIFSFNSQKLNIRWESFTLHWYDVLFNDAEVLLAARNSIIIAIISTVVATVIGTMAALALQRYRFPGYNFAESTLYIPVNHPRSGDGISCWCSSLRLVSNWDWVLYLWLTLHLVSVCDIGCTRQASWIR